MRKKKILCLVGQLGNGGTERQLYLFLKHLDRERFDAHVIVSSGTVGRWTDPIKSLDVKIDHIGSLNPLSKLAAFRRHLSKVKPDIVFSWSFYTNAFKLACPNTAFIGSLRGNLEQARKNSGSLISKLALLPKIFVVNSSALKDELIKAGVDEGRIRFIKNILDMESIPPDNNDRERLRNELSIPPDAKVMMGAGRDIPEKNLDLFLRILANINKINSSIYGIIIGPKMESMERKARELGISQLLFFPGQVANPFEFMRASDVFFLSSRTEGMPNVVIEAILCGCKVATMDVGGINDIKDDNPLAPIKIFRQDEDESKITEEILLLLNAPRGNSSTFNIKAYSPDTIMKEYIKTLKLCES